MDVQVNLRLVTAARRLRQEASRLQALGHIADGVGDRAKARELYAQADAYLKSPVALHRNDSGTMTVEKPERERRG